MKSPSNKPSHNFKAHFYISTANYFIKVMVVLSLRMHLTVGGSYAEISK